MKHLYIPLAVAATCAVLASSGCTPAEYAVLEHLDSRCPPVRIVGVGQILSDDFGASVDVGDSPFSRRYKLIPHIRDPDNALDYVLSIDRTSDGVVINIVDSPHVNDIDERINSICRIKTRRLSG